MTEQEPMIALTEAEPATEPNAQKPTKKTTSQGAKPVKKSTSRTSAVSEEEKRLARNAALRDWRKKNKDRVKAYMTEWRAKRSADKPERPVKLIAASPMASAPAPPSKKAKPSRNTKKSKKGRKA